VGAQGSFVDAIGAIGADSIECAVDADGSVFSLGVSLRDKASIVEFRERTGSQGLRVSALLLATDFSAADAGSQVQWAAHVARGASSIGIPVLRIDPWTARRDLPPETIRDNFVRRAAELLSLTADAGVDFGMENHGQLFNDPQILDWVLSALPHDRFGLTLDTGNLFWWGHPIDQVYRLIERYAPRAKHVHLKNVGYPPELANCQREIGFEYKQYCCPLAEGTLDLNRMVRALVQAGYRRDLCVEDESLFKVPEDQRLEVLKRDVQSLRNCT
jgi:sugar phosphate isomerase/epimerase